MPRRMRMGRVDQVEARRLARQRVDELRRLSYAELRDLFLGRPECREITGESGTVYQSETEAFWDDRQAGDLLVVVSVDDGGWRVFCPLTEGFIIAPDGSLAGGQPQGLRVFNVPFLPSGAASVKRRLAGCLSSCLRVIFPPRGRAGGDERRPLVTGPDERLLIYFRSAKLAAEDVSLLWGLVVDAAAEQRPDELSIEGPATGPDVPPEVGRAQRHLLAGEPLNRRPRRWQWRTIGPGALDEVKLVGPRVIGLNLYRPGSEIAGISDYGMATVVSLPESQWTSLAAAIECALGGLPPHDITPLAAG